MGSLRILFVSPVPPGVVRSRSYHQLRQLLDRGHEVSLACPDDRGGRESRLRELEELGARVITTPISPSRRSLNALGALLLRRPLAARAAWSPHLARRIAEELRGDPYDVLHVEQLGATCYALGAAELLSRSTTARVWDVGKVPGEAPGRHTPAGVPVGIPVRRARRQIRDYMGRLVQSFDRVLLLSRDDLHSIGRAAGRVPRPGSAPAAPLEGLGLLPNGVDCARFTFRDPAARSDIVVFSGAMGEAANAGAARFVAERVMPRIWSRRPDLPVAFIGPAPPRSVRAAMIDHPARVLVPGLVPDVAPFLAAAAVAVAPMAHPGGPRLKVLEALACGTPVVTDAATSHAIGARHEVELLVAGDAEQFAAAVLRLLADTTLRRDLGRAGRALVAGRFAWDRLSGELLSHYDEAIAAGRRRAGPSALVRT